MLKYLILVLIFLHVGCYNSTNCTHGGTEVIPGMCVCKEGFDNSTFCNQPTCGLSDWDAVENRCVCKIGFGGPNCMLPFCSTTGGCLQLYGATRAFCSRYLFLYDGGGMGCEISGSFVADESFFILSELFPNIETESFPSFGGVFGSEFGMQCSGFGAANAASDEYYFRTDEINGGNCEIQFYDFKGSARFETLWFSLGKCNSRIDKTDGFTYYKCLTVTQAECRDSSQSQRCSSPALKYFLQQIQNNPNAVATIECDTRKNCEFDIVNYFPFKVELNRCFASSCIGENQFLKGLDALVQKFEYKPPADVRLILKIVFLCLGFSVFVIFTCLCCCCLGCIEVYLRIIMHIEFHEYRSRYKDIKALEVTFENMRYSTLNKITDRIWIKPEIVLKGLKSNFTKQEMVAIVGLPDSGRDEFLYLLSKQKMSELVPGYYDIDLYFNGLSNDPNSGKGKLVRRTAILRMTGFVAKGDQLDFNLTARENLRFAIELKIPTSANIIHRYKVIGKLLEDIFVNSHGEKDKTKKEKKELRERSGLVVSDLSKCERRLVSIGCQLVHEPLIVFLEDPLVDLPVRSQIRVMRFLRSLVEEGGKSLFLTMTGPVPNNIFFELDQLLFLHDGNIVYQGPVGQVPQFFGGYYEWDKENNIFFGLMDLIKGCSKETLKQFHQIAKTKLAVRKIEKRMSMKLEAPIQIEDEDDHGLSPYGSEKQNMNGDDDKENSDDEWGGPFGETRDSLAISEISQITDLGSIQEDDIRDIDFKQYEEEINAPPPLPPRRRDLENEDDENSNDNNNNETDEKTAPPPPPPPMMDDNDEEEEGGQPTNEKSGEEEEVSDDDDDDFKVVIPRFNENITDDENDDNESEEDDDDSGDADETIVVQDDDDDDESEEDDDEEEEEEEEEGEEDDTDDEDDDEKVKKQTFSIGFRKDVLKSLNLPKPSAKKDDDDEILRFNWERLFLRTPTPHCHQIFTLFIRQVLKYMRNKSLVPLQCTVALIFSFLIGYMYFKQNDTMDGLTNKVNGMFLTFCFYSVLSIFRYKEYVREKEQYKNEIMENSYYYFWVYYLQKLFFDIFPLRFLTQLIGVWTIYYTIGLRPTFDYFFYFWLIFTIVGIINDIVVYNVAMIFGDSFTSQALLVGYFLWNILFSGILIDKSNPNFWNAISVWYWGLKILVINELSLITEEPGTEYRIKQLFPRTIYVTTLGRIVLENRWGYKDLETGVDLAFLCLIIIFFLVLIFTFFMLCCLTLKPYCCIINLSYFRLVIKMVKTWVPVVYDFAKEKIGKNTEEEDND